VESIPFLLLSGKADVGVYVEDLYQRSYAYDEAAKQLRVLVYSPPIPQFPFAVREGLDTASIAVLREALSRIDGSSAFGHEFLAELRIDRISRADDASYDEFRAYYQSVKR